MTLRDADRRRWASPRQEMTGPPTWPFALLIAFTMVVVIATGHWDVSHVFSVAEKVVLIALVAVLSVAAMLFRRNTGVQHAVLVMTVAADFLLLVEADTLAGAMLTNYAFVFCVMVAAAAFPRPVASAYLLGTLAAAAAGMWISPLDLPVVVWLVELGAIAGTGLAVGYMVGWLRWYAMTDDLTGVATRRAFTGMLDTHLKMARTRGAPVCLALIDLDGFKELNDAEGHPAGDQLLRDVADAWRVRLRSDDLIARIGGDEFALVLPHTDAVDARRLLNLLAMHSPAAWSAGVAQNRAEDTVSTMMDRADADLYRVKRARKALRGSAAAG